MILTGIVNSLKRFLSGLKLNPNSNIIVNIPYIDISSASTNSFILL
jgi:hypothetical protein